MNYRKDILEKVKHLQKTEPGLKRNYAKLSREFNCDYRTVKKHFEAVENGTDSPPKRDYAKKTAGFEQIIEEKLKTGAPVIAIYQYLVKHKGYSGSYSTLTAYVRSLRRLREREANIRFETEPGVQAQVDWKESLKFRTKTGDTIQFNVFLLILGFSRTKFLMVTESRDLRQVEFSLACAFRYIGGVPREILFDNMRSIIDKARTQYSEPVFDEEFKLFARDCGFVPKACVAYRPCTKGKVEVTAKLMNRLKVYSGDIESFDDIKTIAAELNKEINNEICQGTGFRPFDRLPLEQSCMIHTDLNILTGYFMKPVTRKVSKESLITVEGKKYSLPPKYIGKRVEIVENGDDLDIYYEGSLIKQWKKSEKMYNYDREDYRAILSSGALKELSDDEIAEMAERNMAIYDKL